MHSLTYFPTVHIIQCDCCYSDVGHDKEACLENKVGVIKTSKRLSKREDTFDLEERWEGREEEGV